MPGQHVAIIEDEDDILELISYNLRKEGYRVTTATSGEAGLLAVRNTLPDLVLLDLMLPGVDGFEVCRSLKKSAETSHIPIIMLTAKGEETDVVAGLELGADDYITKPFSPRVLLARVRAILRRKPKTEDEGSSPIVVHDVAIHPGRHEVTVGGVHVALTHTEFNLLHLLASRPGWVFTRYQIVEAIRGDNSPVTDRSVDVHVVGLRKKLGQAGRYIETVRGMGYRFKG
ncbi:MAG TPA: response regulator transcription factor [Candidatus Latescibacteria bacterium]|nr:response regulator transcription factor [Candidatus Latescibacterota bacterium]HRU23686.1 response regulator transcription factor [Candidatus Latescibacterota bacterium]